LNSKTESRARLLVVSTTPGPSKALADVVQRLVRGFEVIVLTSNDAGFGRGDAVYRRFGIDAELVEDACIGYVPVEVSERQAEALLARFRPQAVLAGAVYDPSGQEKPLEDALCMAASRAGIPNLQFVEGWEVWSRRAWTREIAEGFLVVDDYVKALIEAEGVPAKRIEVVGYPRSLFVPPVVDSVRRAEIRERLGLGAGDRLTVYLGQVTPDNALTLGWAAAALSPRDRLLLQRHPRDLRPLEDLLRFCPPGSVIASDIETDSALHAADLCVSHFSLSSFTSAYLGIPTILTLLPDDATRIRKVLGLYPTTLLGGTVEVHSSDEYARAFAAAQPPSADFLSRIRRSIASSTEAIVGHVERISKQLSTST